MIERKQGWLLTLVICALLSVTLMGCSDDEDMSGETLSERVAAGLSMQAERGTGSLTITRPALTGKKPKGVSSGTWTVFVYLCGSDLETNGGAATRDLAEMVGASGSENVSFVVETGGAKKWQGNAGGSGINRYFIQDGAIMEVDKGKKADMGKPSTLSDFLGWGLQNYPADHMGLILWDHGGGSLSGVCFDEKNDYDSLLLAELDSAFSAVSDKMWQKFDFVGFDACLMGTLECANTMASYADYLIASEEIEPGSGWEYSSIMEFLAAYPQATGKELGQALADSYQQSVSPHSINNITLSVIDLSKTDDLMNDFYHFSQEMFASGEDQGTLAAMTRGIKGADKFGTNNMLEGYTNMVDLGGLVKACAEVTPSSADVLSDLDEAVVYQVKGRSHRNASGLSLYYPLSINNANEFTAFQTVAANPSYLSYVDRLAHGATYAGTESSEDYTNYTDEEWFDSEGVWNMVMTGAEILAMLSERSVDPRWTYVDDHAKESEVVTFASEPAVNDQGVYWFKLDDKGIDNVATVSALIYANQKDGKPYSLGETFDIYADWKTGVVEDGFDGTWLALPDGQLLALYVVDYTTDEVTYTSPVRVNGTDCYLRLFQDLKTGEVTVEGIWDGEGDQGQVSRGGLELVDGDSIVPLYSPDTGYVQPGALDLTIEGTEFKVGQDGLVVDYVDLPLGVYHYSFNICDVFGNHKVTDPVEFDIEEDGIYFVEE